MPENSAEAKKTADTSSMPHFTPPKPFCIPMTVIIIAAKMLSSTATWRPVTVTSLLVSSTRSETSTPWTKLFAGSLAIRLAYTTV